MMERRTVFHRLGDPVADMGAMNHINNMGYSRYRREVRAESNR